jgi:hypothetical protein
MKSLFTMAAAIFVAVPGFAAEPKKAAKKSGMEEPPVEQQTQPRWVVILGVYKDFHEAKANGQKFSKTSKVPFSLHGMIFDKKGLRLPDNHEDPVWAGEYLARRYNTAWSGERELPEHISVERSEGYEGFAKGFYIVVGGIAETKKEGLDQGERFKAFAPDAYVKKTRIYMGCIH